MTKGYFGKKLGYLGIVSGIGFAGVVVNLIFPTPGLDFLDGLTILWLLWLFGVGYKLIKLNPSE